ncbi:hypothetical protein CK203_111400 [Vitis vinifera]|uniref:Uncharacterized protein n=1 Tax=Vitis vinifera TaxID=29760 RepID=A0A438FEZ7_VITVI|nr:hypothetical protein CK203_111400 [Vitis vinifera]
MDFYQSMTTKQVRDPTLIHFTIDGRHGILGARHIAEALHIPYEPSHFEDYRVWTSPSQLEMVISCPEELPQIHISLDSEERSSFRGPVQDFKGYFFGPHHLIMAALLYFEEKVHKKKLQELMPFHFFFHGCCVRFWSIWGIHQILSWSASVFAERAPPVTPASSSHLLQLSQGWPFPFQSIESYAAHCDPDASQSSLAQEMAAIRACQEQMLTTQAQHTAILRQLQHHLGLPSAAEHLTPPLQCHTRRPQSLRPS